MNVEFQGQKDNYRMISVLGRGGYGVVFKAESLTNGKKFAIKVFTDASEEVNEEYQTELNIGRLVKISEECYPYIVCVVDTGVVEGSGLAEVFVPDDPDLPPSHIRTMRRYIKGDYDFIVQELLDGDIASIELKPNEFVRLMVNTLKGIKWMHDKGLAHNDIKPYNILYKNEGGKERRFLVGDLGSSCTSLEISSDFKRDCIGYATKIYASPYILSKFYEPITIRKAQLGDLWSLGVVFYEAIHRVITGKLEINDWVHNLPYDYRAYEYNFDILGLRNSKYYVDKFRLLTQGEIYPAEFTVKGMDMDKINRVINGLLTVDDDTRMSAEEALELLESY